MKEQLYQLFQGTTGAPTVEDLLLRVGVSVVIGLAIFVSYWISHAGTIYSQKFNINLITLTILTATVMTVIGNNIALSLGMVGALSIVRFRTAIKDPRDTTYIFWAIICGICCGVGMFMAAAIGSVAVFVVMLILGRVRNDVRTLLENHFTGGPSKRLTIADIQKEVENFYKVSHADLVGKKRTRNIIYARQIAIYLCRQMLDLPFNDIGKKFNRDHSTVMYSVTNVEEKMKESRELREELETLKQLIREI